MSKKQFKVDITIAVEAENVDEAFELLMSKETLEHVIKAIKKSKERIVESLKEVDTEIIIN